MYSKEEIQAELDKLNWQTAPNNYINNCKDVSGNYLLFRGHDRLEDNVFQTAGLVHLTPFFNTAASIFRFKLSKNYQDFPPRYFFISVYAGGKQNKFYPDETLEYVVKGETIDSGVHIDSINDFDKVLHFETAKLPENTKISTYIVKLENPVRKDSLKIAEISDKLKEMLRANKKPEPEMIMRMEQQKRDY